MDLFELSAKIELDTENYEQSIKDAAKSAEKVEDSFDDLGDSADRASKYIPYLDDSLDDVEYSGNKAGITIEKTTDSVEDLGKESEKTSQKTEDLGDSVDDSGDSFFKTIVKADQFSNALSKAGEIAVDVAKYIWNLDEATEEYRASQAKLNTAFRVSGFGANTAKVAFQGLYRAVGDIDQATEASQLLSQLALTTEDVAKWTEIATGVVGTFGDSLPIESLIESANETARTGKVVGTLADALNWAGNVGEDEFNAMLAECKTQEEKVNLITETLSETYKGAADTFKETSSSLMSARDALIEVQDASAEAGEAIGGMKTSMEQAASYAKIGFFSSVKDIASAFSDLNDGTRSSKDLYRDWVKTVEERISTGSIDEATGAFEELGRVIKYFDDHPIDAIFEFGGFFTAKGAQGELNDLLKVAEERFVGTGDSAELAATQEERLAAASAEVVEEIEPIIATADGVSVALEGTGLTAEEASSRLQTYTSAALNMFDRISEESELSYQDAIGNLEANIEATNRFADNMTSIAGSLPPALAEMFRAGGPQMYAGVVAMLAEANAGTDEGLSQLNQLWEQGGEAAVNAFITSLGKIPEDTQDPAKIVAAQMEEDTSMEAAGVSAVDRTATAMSDAVSSAGFDSSGSLAMAKFIAGLESQRGAIMAKARDLAQAAKREIDAVLNSVASGGSGRAGGLDYVPHNGYPATLHAGEAVLTAREAKEWRAGNSGNGKSVVINQYINSVPMTPVELEAAAASYLEQVVWRL